MLIALMAGIALVFCIWLVVDEAIFSARLKADTKRRIEEINAFYKQ